MNANEARELRDNAYEEPLERCYDIIRDRASSGYSDADISLFGNYSPLIQIIADILKDNEYEVRQLGHSLIVSWEEK